MSKKGGRRLRNHGSRRSGRRVEGLRSEIAPTVAFFGLLIGVVLLGCQLLALWWWPSGLFDVHTGVVGALFLSAGVVVGLRVRRISASRPDPTGERAVGAGAEVESNRSVGAPSLVEPLTPRELEILGSLAAGCSNAEIADRHFVSPNTVKTHLRQIYGKLEVSRRVQAVSRARQIGLVE